MKQTYFFILLFLLSCNSVLSQLESCQNGGFNGVNGCSCQGLFYSSDCSKLQCINGGFQPVSSVYTPCTCPKGYVGISCEGSNFNLKPAQIFSVAPSKSFNLFVQTASTAYYGKKGFDGLKLLVSQYITANANSFDSFNLIAMDSSVNNKIIFDATAATFTAEFNNIVHSTPTSYSCYSTPLYAQILSMINSKRTSKLIQNSAILVYTQHPPSDYDSNFEALEEITSAFKIKMNIVFQNDKTLSYCDKQTPEIRDAFNSLEKLSFVSGGVFIELDQENPTDGIQFVLNTLYNPQLVSYAYQSDCTKDIILPYQSDRFLNGHYLVVKSDAPLDAASASVSVSSITSSLALMDKKGLLITLGKGLRTTKAGSTITLKGLAGACSVQFIATYGVIPFEYGIDVYQTYVDPKTSQDSAYIFMREGTQSGIKFSLEVQSELSSIIGDYQMIPTSGSYYTNGVATNNQISITNQTAYGQSIFQYTLGDETSTYTCDSKYKNWFTVTMQDSVTNYLYQRYVPIKCISIPSPVTSAPTNLPTTSTSIPSTVGPTLTPTSIPSTVAPTLTPTSIPSTVASTLTSTSIPSTVAPTLTSTLLSTTSYVTSTSAPLVPVSRQATLGVVLACDAEPTFYGVIGNGLHSISDDAIAFYTNYSLTVVSSTGVIKKMFYTDFDSFKYDMSTIVTICNGDNAQTSAAIFFPSVTEMINSPDYISNSPVILIPSAEMLTLPTAATDFLKTLETAAVAKRINVISYINIAPQKDNFYQGINDICSELAEVSNGHVFYIDHTIQSIDGSYYAAGLISDYFTNTYPKKLILARTFALRPTFGNIELDSFSLGGQHVPQNITIIASTQFNSNSTGGFPMKIWLMGRGNPKPIYHNIIPTDPNIKNYVAYTFENVPGNNVYTVKVFAFVNNPNGSPAKIAVRVYQDHAANYVDHININYKQIENNVATTSLLTSPDSTNGIVINAQIYTEVGQSVNNVILTLSQPAGNDKTKDVKFTSINTDTKIFVSQQPDVANMFDAYLYPIVDLSATNTALNTQYSKLPYYTAKVSVIMKNPVSTHDFVFNVLVQDQKNFIQTIDYPKFKQGKSDQFRYCENSVPLTFNYSAKEYVCDCSGNDLITGEFCEHVSCPVKVDPYAGFNDLTNRMLTIVFAGGDLTKIADQTKDAFVTNGIYHSEIWQFRVYNYISPTNIQSLYIGSNYDDFLMSFGKYTFDSTLTQDHLCIQDLKNALYTYYPASVKGIIWAVTDLPFAPQPSISTTAITPPKYIFDWLFENDVPVPSTTVAPLSFVCQDDLTNGYNQDFFLNYVYSPNDAAGESSIYLNGGLAISYTDNTFPNYEEIITKVLTNLLQGKIAYGGYNDLVVKGTPKVYTPDKASTFVFKPVTGKLNPGDVVFESTPNSGAQGTPLQFDVSSDSILISYITPASGDSFTINAKVDILVTVYIQSDIGINVAFLNDNSADIPSNVPLSINNHYGIWFDEEVRDIVVNEPTDSLNTYQDTRDCKVYKHGFVQQTANSHNSANPLSFTFTAILEFGEVNVTRVYPNNPNKNDVNQLSNSGLMASLTCRNGKYVNITDSKQNVISSSCVCDVNYRGTDCSTPICNNGGILNAMQNQCYCKDTSYFGLFCETPIVMH